MDWKEQRLETRAVRAGDPSPRIGGALSIPIFQSAVFLLYITMGKVDGGTAPIFQAGVANQVFSNPLPQVLILTAIVVGISTTALGLGIVVRIKEEYGSIEEDQIQEIDRQ